MSGLKQTLGLMTKVILLWMLAASVFAEKTLSFVHNDHLGTPRVITDENKNIVWEAEYTPFGQANITTETITNNLRFPGQYWDEETGLHYNHFRYYDPSMGRYITSDRIGLGDGPNTYLYAQANPLKYTDPTGEAAQAIPQAIFIGGVTICTRFPKACARILVSAGKSIVGAFSDTNEVASSEVCPVEPNGEDPCAEIEKKIDAAWKKLRRGIKNQKNPKGKKGGGPGHLENFNNTKANLRKLIEQAKKYNCYIDPRAYDFLDRDFPRF